MAIGNDPEKARVYAMPFDSLPQPRAAAQDYNPAPFVDAGARLLDQVHPGWARKISLVRLQMDNAKECMLAQLYGDFRRGLEAVGLVPGDRFVQAAYGFNYDPCCGRPWRFQYTSLKRLWHRQVAARL